VSDTAQFARGLLDPACPVPALVKGQSVRRYAVYRNNVTVSLIKALEANFPTVRKLLGEDYFAGFAREYAQCNPPLSPLLLKFGATFPHALTQTEDLKNYPYLADIAQLEIFWRESYHAADATPLEADALASVDPEALFNSRLIGHPSLRLLQSQFAAHDIFVANRPGGTGQPYNPAKPQSVLLVRPHYEVEIHAVSADQFEFLNALQQGVSFGEALERAAAANEKFDAPGTIALMLQSGAFHSIQEGH
jgi:Putative DNA-binding domain